VHGTILQRKFDANGNKTKLSSIFQILTNFDVIIITCHQNVSHERVNDLDNS
jgi:hypothetical protein